MLFLKIKIQPQHFSYGYYDNITRYQCRSMQFFLIFKFEISKIETRKKSLRKSTHRNIFDKASSVSEFFYWLHSSPS